MQILYDELHAAGCEMDGRYSDLYVRPTRKAREILSRYPTERANSHTFQADDGSGMWIEVPFAYAPYWRAATKRP